MIQLPGRTRRFLVRVLGGVIRERVPVDRVPPSLLTALRLTDGLMSQREWAAAQSQLRGVLATYSRDGFVSPRPARPPEKNDA